LKIKKKKKTQTINLNTGGMYQVRKSLTRIVREKSDQTTFMDSQN